MIAGERFEELTGAGAGNGSDVLFDFIPRHADPVIGQGEGARILVKLDPDAEIGVTFVERIIAQRVESKLVCSVGRVGDQFSEKDFLVAVERMDHEVQQLLDLSLKAHRDLIFRDSHGVVSLQMCIKVLRHKPHDSNMGS